MAVGPRSEPMAKNTEELISSISFYLFSAIMPEIRAIDHSLILYLYHAS
jgi:hypothetical protein